MFEKKNSVLDNTTDTAETHTSNGNDTTTPENTVISTEGKSSDFSGDKQAGTEESSVNASEGKLLEQGEGLMLKLEELERSRLRSMLLRGDESGATGSKLCKFTAFFFNSSNKSFVHYWIFL